jgi:hypothetical protein
MTKIVRRETEVSVTLSRATNRGDAEWLLRVVDNRSGVEILQARLNHFAFGDMMSSTIGGNLAQAEVALVPWVGKYAVRHSEVVSTLGIFHNELATTLNEKGEAIARAMREAHGDHTDLGWRYTGFQGGGGGSNRRTLTFVRFADEPEDQ